MTTVADIKQAIADEAAEVKKRFDEQEATIAELAARKDGATKEELTDLLAGVRGIFNPTPSANIDGPLKPIS